MRWDPAGRRWLDIFSSSFVQNFSPGIREATVFEDSSPGVLSFGLQSAIQPANTLASKEPPPADTLVAKEPPPADAIVPKEPPPADALMAEQPPGT